MITNFKLKGLTCEACVKMASMRLKCLAGVKDVVINLNTGETAITAKNEISAKEAKLALAGTPYSIVESWTFPA